ncbi:MAG TPA: hypothetical protein VE152_01755 [Acidimicrobiales bacterium]|nr:hypothetical protein [Acidimicrobiales bacterium]
MLGANRVLRGPAITSPCGTSRPERVELVRRAAALLGVAVDCPTVWEVSP